MTIGNLFCAFYSTNQPKGGTTIELFLQVDNTNQFMTQLWEYIQSEIDPQMKQTKDDDSLYIGCENFYAYILTEDIPSYECVERELDVTLNLDIDIEIYQKKQTEGVVNLRTIIEWFLETFAGDLVLFSDTSELIALRRRGEIIHEL